MSFNTVIPKKISDEAKKKGIDTEYEIKDIKVIK